MKRILVLLIVLALLYPAHSMIPIEGTQTRTEQEYKGWIIEFHKKPIAEENTEINTAVSEWKNKKNTNTELSAFQNSLYNTLTQTAKETKGFVLASSSGKLAGSQEKTIEKICKKIKVEDCQALIMSKFFLAFNGIAMNISDHQARKISEMPEVKSINPNYRLKLALNDAVKIIELASESGENIIQRKVPYTGKGIKIGVFDTGIDLEHEAFGDCSEEKFYKGECERVTIGVDDCWPEKAEKEKDPNCPKEAAIVDIVGQDMNPSYKGSFKTNRLDRPDHGSHVASIAAGKPDPNKDGIQQKNEYWGIAPYAEIVPMRVTVWDETQYWIPATSRNTVILGIEKAMDPRKKCSKSLKECDLSERLDVVNMSLGQNIKTYGPDAVAIDNAVDSGVVVVCAAGNGRRIASVEGPGYAKKSISVGAITKEKKIALFSSGGPHIWDNGALMKPDVVAPGKLICGALSKGVKEEIQSGSQLDEEVKELLLPLIELCTGDNYIALYGTSMATPFVSGLVALIREKHSEFSALEVKMVIRNTAEDLGIPLVKQGFGLANAKKALSVEDAPPIAMLEPLGTYNNTVGFQTVKIRGLAYTSILEDFKEYKLELGKSPLSTFTFSKDKQIEWIELKKSDNPSRDVLLDEFNAFDITGGEEGQYLLKLTVSNTNNQKSIDYLPMSVSSSIDQALGLKCEETEMSEKRAWSWRFSSEMDGYLDATQFFISIAKNVHNVKSGLEYALESLSPTREGIVWERINNETPKSDYQMIIDLLFCGENQWFHNYLVLPSITQEEYVYYPLKEHQVSFSNGSVYRRTEKIENDECTLEKAYESFLKEMEEKTFKGKQVSERTLNSLESSVKECYGEEYSLDNIYVNYSNPYGGPRQQWEEEKPVIIERVKSPIVEYSRNKYGEQPFIDKDWWENKEIHLLSFDVLVEIQEQLAQEIKSGDCLSVGDRLNESGKCKIELFGEKISGSVKEWQDYFEFLKKHSHWYFSFLLGGERSKEEKELLKKDLLVWIPASILKYLPRDKREFYLVGDSISEDFKSDFSEYYSDELKELGVDISNWSFSGEPIEQGYSTGDYIVHQKYDFDFDDLENIKIIGVELDVELHEKIKEPINPFIKIPFDGEIGLKNGRNGYGVSISYFGNKPIYFNHETSEEGKRFEKKMFEEKAGEEILKPSKGPNSNNIAKIKVEYSNELNLTKNGSIITISENREAEEKEYHIKFSPSIPIKLKLRGELSEENVSSEKIRFYYGLCKTKQCLSLSKEEYETNWLFKWFDKSKNLYTDELKEHTDSDCIGWGDKLFNAKLGIPPKTLEETQNNSNSLISAVSFLPLNTTVVVHCLSGNIQNPKLEMESVEGVPSDEINIVPNQYYAGGGNILEITPTQKIKNLDFKSVNDGLTYKEYCLNELGNSKSFVWSPYKLLPQEKYKPSEEYKLKGKNCVYDKDEKKITFSIENTGKASLHDFNITIYYPDYSSDLKTIETVLKPSESKPYSLTVKDKPRSINISIILPGIEEELTYVMTCKQKKSTNQ